MTLPVAQILHRAGRWPGLATGRVVLGYEVRFMRRKRLVTAADEDVLIVTGDITRLAWHTDNRHTPCKIEDARLVIRADHVLAEMLRGLGAVVVPARAPFTPEGGAYGPGLVMEHEH